jgi:hypothetical protein
MIAWAFFCPPHPKRIRISCWRGVYLILNHHTRWHYDEKSSIASEHGAAGVHYLCMSTDAICALPVKELATDAVRPPDF